MLGQTWTDDCWFVPMTVGGVQCSALVDTGSSPTLLKPGLVRSTDVLPTTTKLQTVTRDCAPMVGTGQKEFCCPVWVTNLKDCILGLDVLRPLDCVINTRGGTLNFPDGQVVQMSGLPSKLNWTINHQIAVLTTESVGDTAVYGRSADSLSVEPTAMTSDCLATQKVLATARPIKPNNAAVAPAILLATETTAAMTDSAERVEAVREVWLKKL